MAGDGSVCAGRSDDISERDKLLKKQKTKIKITFQDLSRCWKSLLHFSDRRRRLNFNHTLGDVI